MSITVTITDPRQMAGVAAAAAATPVADGEPAPTPQEYLQRIVEGAAMSYRDSFAVDRITAAAFVFRFTEAEYASIKASTDPIVQGFIARLDSEPYVWLGSDEVQQGVGYVVSLGMLTQARAAEILTY